MNVFVLVVSAVCFLFCAVVSAKAYRECWRGELEDYMFMSVLLLITSFPVIIFVGTLLGKVNYG